MSIDTLIAAIDTEISRLQQARVLLSGTGSPGAKKRGRPAKTAQALEAPAMKLKPAWKKTKRNLTPEGRARIAAAVKARWARVEIAKKTAGASEPSTPKQ